MRAIKRLKAKDAKKIVRALNIPVCYRDRGFRNRFVSLQTVIEL